MQPLLTLLLAGLIAWSQVPAMAQAAQYTKISDRPIPDKWALVVGISQFQDPSLNLQYSAKDATDFYNYLVKEAHFAPDHVRLLLNENASRENVLSQVGDKWLPRVVAPDDLVVIYISSHGSPSSMDVAGANYVVAYNTDRDQLYATGIPMDEFAQMIKSRVHTDRVVLILDACHSGSAKTADKGLIRRTNFDAASLPLGEGQLVICSSAPDQVSWESKRYANGVFTHHLIDSLRKQPKMNESYQLLKQQVQTEVLADRGELQVPALKTKWTGGELVLNTVPASPRAGIPDIPMKKPAVAVNQQVLQTTARPGGQSMAQTVQIAVQPAAAQNKPIQVRPAAGVGLVSQPTIVHIQPPVQQPAPAPQVAAPYGEYGSNGKVKMKMLDVEKRMTGIFYTIETQNISAAPVNGYNWGYSFFKDGYLVSKTSRSGVYGADIDLGPGVKCKMDMSSPSESDTVVIKFDKPGWGTIKLRTSTDDLSSDGAQAGSPFATSGTASLSAAYGDYAFNGKVQMKVLDTDKKMTGFFVTTEVLNATSDPVDPGSLTFEFYNDGYVVSKSTGSGIYSTTESIPSGAKAKLDVSTPDTADKLIIKFPKPGWNPLTLNLK